MEPAAARSYELASLSGSESAGGLEFLMSLEAPSPAVQQAVKSGAAWFELVKIEGIHIETVNGDRQVKRDDSATPIGARFCEIETNRPFFYDRDVVPKYALKEIRSERRNRNTWYGAWGKSLLNTYAKWP